MIRSHFGIETNPFEPNSLTLLNHQQTVFETIKVHAQQGGLCLLMGEPGTGKSTIKQAIIEHDPKRMITPTIGRSLHTYSNTLTILAEAFKVETEGRDSQRERLLIEQAWKINNKGNMLVPIIDDAHLMDIHCLRKLRLLFEDFPKSHNLVLIAQPSIMGTLQLAINEDIKGRITYSTTLLKLNEDDIRTFIYDQFDRVKLGHNAISEDAMELIIRSAEGILRRVRNLCVSAMLECVRARVRVIGLDQVNAVLMQPHWRREHDLANR